MTDYYQLDLDDMVIALNNKDVDIELLQKKLEIATKALQYYAEGTLGGSFASETLKEMEEVTTETIKERRNNE